MRKFWISLSCSQHLLLAVLACSVLGLQTLSAQEVAKPEFTPRLVGVLNTGNSTSYVDLKVDNSGDSLLICKAIK